MFENVEGKQFIASPRFLYVTSGSLQGDTSPKLLKNSPFHNPSFLARFLYYYPVAAGSAARRIETMMTTTETGTPLAVKSAPQQVVVVSKQSQINGLLETV